MNSVIGVFSRGPLEAYSMKPKKVRKAAAVTSPASLEANTSRPSTYTAHTHAVAMSHEEQPHREHVVEPADAGDADADRRDHVRERTGPVQDAEVRRNAFGDLLAGVAVDGEITGEHAVEPVQRIGEQGDPADQEHEGVHRPPPRIHDATLEPGRARTLRGSAWH